jgi:hypothetical protein
MSVAWKLNRLESGRSKASLLKRVLKPVYKSFMRAIPETRFGDRLFSCIKFVRYHQRLPSDAKTYNDVLYKIKTTNEILDPLRVFVSDKEFVKLYVKAIVGDEYNVPTIDVIRNIEAIDMYEFPARCCIKPTHASGRVVIRRNGEQVDREKIKSWFINHYHINREANYKMLRPKVIIEPLIFDSSSVEDYKIFCVKGTPKIIQVDVDRHIEHKRKYFDANWRELDFSIKYPRTDQALARPENFPEMLAVAAELSKNFWFVRIDLYSNGSKLLVGEITHCADSADGKFTSEAAEKTVSDYMFRDAPLSGVDALAQAHEGHSLARARAGS